MRTKQNKMENIAKNCWLETNVTRSKRTNFMRNVMRFLCIILLLLVADWKIAKQRARRAFHLTSQLFPGATLVFFPLITCSRAVIIVIYSKICWHCFQLYFLAKSFVSFLSKVKECTSCKIFNRKFYWRAAIYILCIHYLLAVCVCDFDSIFSYILIHGVWASRCCHLKPVKILNKNFSAKLSPTRCQSKRFCLTTEVSSPFQCIKKRNNKFSLLGLCLGPIYLLIIRHDNGFIWQSRWHNHIHN